DPGARCRVPRFHRHDRGTGGRGDSQTGARAYFERAHLERKGTARVFSMNNLLVMKFGGTSVGSADRMKVACDLIAAEAARRPVLAVVSAMSKITDLLLDTTRHAEGGDQAGLDKNLRQLETRHFEAATGLIPASSQD